MSFAGALKWSFLSELSGRIVPPLVFVILARLLTPEDFGVVAAATMVISFSQVFWEAGMGKAVIQYRGDRAASADVAFWINCGLAIVVAAILITAAGALAESVFHDARVTIVLQVMSLQVLLSALVSVQTALLQKDMQFKPLFWVRLATVALPAIVSVPLAWQGAGYWALIAGALAGQAAQVVVLWRMSRWRPRLSFDGGVARDLAAFGGWVVLSGLLAWFYAWADALVVGMYLGSHELGLYRTGGQLATMVFALVFAPVLPVLYSHLSHIGEDRAELAQAMDKTIRILIVLAIPLAFVLYSLAEPLAAILFGEAWRGIGFVIGLMALMHGFSWVVGMNGEAYRAMGKPSYEAIVSAATLAIYLAAYLASIRHGLEAFVWARLALALGALLLHLLVLRRLVSIALAPIARRLAKVVAASATVAVPVALAFSFGGMGVSHQFLLGACGVVMLGTTIYSIERNGTVKEIAEMIRNRDR